MSAEIELAMVGSGEVGTIWSGWNVSEGATPINASESPNGSGAATFSALPTATSAFIIDNSATFTHESLGDFQGVVTAVSDGSATGATISSNLSLLQAERNMPPTGEQTLADIISSYVAAVTDQLTVSYIATENPVKVFGGWSGDVWYYLNQLCSVNGLEIALSGSTVIIRDAASSTLDLEDSATPVRTPNTQSAGRTVEVNYYNPVLVASLGTTKYNYSQNPSLETNATGWTSAVDGTLGGSGGSITSSGRATTAAYSGTASYRVRMTDSVGAAAPGVYTHTVVAFLYHTLSVTGITDGDTVSAAAYISKGTAYPGTVRIDVDWLNGGGTVIGTSLGTTFALPSAGSSWTRATLPDIVKFPGSVSARISLRVRVFGYSASSSPATNQDIFADAALFTNGSMVPYFDGSTAGASWGGTANNSISLIPIPGENDFYNAYNDNNTIYSVSAGEIVKTVVQTTNYPTFLAQPFQTNVFPNIVGSYYVSAADNLPVPSSEWAAYGGKVEVAIGEVPGTIEITLTAPSVEIPGVPSPYSLAVSDGQNSYAALSVAGIGVVTTPQKIILGTGADFAKTTTEVAASLDSPFVDTINQAYTTGAWMQLDATGSIGLSCSIGTHQIDGFGQTAGSVTRTKNSIYRHITVNIGATNTSLTSRSFVTAGDIDAVWSGATAGQFDAEWSGYSAGDIHIEPLRRG